MKILDLIIYVFWAAVSLLIIYAVIRDGILGDYFDRKEAEAYNKGYEDAKDQVDSSR